MTRTTTEAAIVGGPTIASTRDYWVLHLKSEHRAERTISTYLNALRRLDEFLADRGMPRELSAIRREHLEAWIAELGTREELKQLRPALDGNEVMEHLDLKPSRTVGEALDFLMEVRLDEGEISKEEAYRRLDAWYAKRPKA